MRLAGLTRLAFAVVAVISLSGAASAQVPPLVSYQGVLLSGGSPVANGNYSMSFALFDASTVGLNVWSGTVSTVPVTNGAFSVQLSGITGDIASKPLWLEITVTGGPVSAGPYPFTLSPRTQLTSAPYALTASAVRSNVNGGARVLDSQGDTPQTPAIGFFSTNGVDDGGGGNGIYRPLANTMAFATSSTERMRITSGGNVGIGLAPGASPQARIHAATTGNGILSEVTQAADFGYGIISKVNRSQAKAVAVQNSGTGNEDFIVYGDGRVFAREVTVTSQNPFPDYVFGPDYSLMPLDELQAFVVRNGHLPDMPTAQDVSRTGLRVGDVETRLVQKVEELTLYVLQLKRDNDLLRQELHHTTP